MISYNFTVLKMAMQVEQFVKNSIKLVKNGRQMSSGLISGSSENGKFLNLSNY